MNRIVRERYPVSKLPEDLRREFEGQEFVDIVATATDQTDADKGRAPDTADANHGGQFSRFKHLRRSTYTSLEEVNAYVGGLRDEWAHRERCGARSTSTQTS